THLQEPPRDPQRFKTALALVLTNFQKFVDKFGREEAQNVFRRLAPDFPHYLLSKSDEERNKMLEILQGKTNGYISDLIDDMPTKVKIGWRVGEIQPQIKKIIYQKNIGIRPEHADDHTDPAGHIGILSFRMSQLDNIKDFVKGKSTPTLAVQLDM